MESAADFDFAYDGSIPSPLATMWKHQGESLDASLPMHGWREYPFALNDLSTRLLSGRVVQWLERTPYKRLTIVQLYP